MTRSLRRNGWILGLLALLVVLLAMTKLIQPGFGATGIEALVRAALPFAFATAGMAIVVIAGGIDLSVASVTAAVLMEAWGGAATVPVLLLVLLLGTGWGR